MSEELPCPICEGVELIPYKWELKYKKCETHDVCINCGVRRKDLDEIPWWHKEGIICKPCKKKEIQRTIEEFEKRLEREGDFFLDHNDSPICPYCGHEYGDAWELDPDTEEIECGYCDNTMKVDIYHEVTYSTERKED